MGVKIVTPSATLDAGQKIAALKRKLAAEEKKRKEHERRLDALEKLLSEGKS